MNLKKLFIVANLIGVVILGTSCSKENFENKSDEKIITLTVPAMPGFGDDAASRTIFEDDGTRPSVRWSVGDPIYIGSARSTTEDLKKTLKALTDEGKFSVFNCTSVADDGTATFTGTFIPNGADIALYTKHPELVTKAYANSYVAFDAPCTTVAPQSNGSLEHLGDNDLMVATFNSETKTFQMGTGSYSNKAFGRVFGLGKFVLNLPNGTTGVLGNFRCLSTGTGKLSSKGRVQIYNLHDNTGLPKLWGISGDYIIDCKNLEIKNNQVVFYSLLGNGNINGKILNFSLEVDEKTYYATITAGANIAQTLAVVINLNFTEQPAE